jgi:ankyrin repeat protein
MGGGDWMDLCRAARDGDLDLVKYHVAQDVDVNYVHPEYMSTLLVTAIRAGHESIALFLLESGSDPSALSEFEQVTPLQAARTVGMAAVEARLRDKGAV